MASIQVQADIKPGGKFDVTKSEYVGYTNDDTEWGEISTVKGAIDKLHGIMTAAPTLSYWDERQKKGELKGWAIGQ